MHYLLLVVSLILTSCTNKPITPKRGDRADASADPCLSQDISTIPDYCSEETSESEDAPASTKLFKWDGKSIKTVGYELDVIPIQ